MPVKPGKTKRAAPSVRLGNIRVTPLGRGKVWLINRAGEGMETSAAKFGAWVEQYFNREF